MKYIRQGQLSIARIMLEFVNNELLPDTNINPKKFWIGFDKIVHELTPINRKLLSTRKQMQNEIDNWHISRKGKKMDLIEYESFLKKINYLVKEGPNFKIKTKNVDIEIANIPGPQLVVPIRMLDTH